MKNDRNKATPIIIKRVVSGRSHSAHGGSWKVAYADFVTAMMAFFLLLWLLNSVPTPKLKSIAAYFEPTIGMLNKSGENSDDGNQKSESKDQVDSKGSNVKGFVYGVPQTGQVISTAQQGVTKEEELQETENFNLFESEIKKVMSADSSLSSMKDNIQFEQTPEGLLINITDKNNTMMFDQGTANLKPYAKSILIKIADMIKFAPNFIVVNGYTDKTNEDPLANYTNWNLSADRANSSRHFLVNNGMAPEKIARVSGYADANPLVPENPYDPRNRRISILLLRNSIAPSYKVAITKDLGTLSASPSKTQ